MLKNYLLILGALIILWNTKKKIKKLLVIKEIPFHNPHKQVWKYRENQQLVFT